MRLKHDVVTEDAIDADDDAATDPANEAASDSAMIALLPVTNDWCRQELAHLTLVYAGLVKDLKPTDFNELGKDASALSMLASPLMLRVTGVQVFGPDDDKVDVLTLQPSSELWAMRRAVEDWNQSQFEFSPHCTIGPSLGSPPISYNQNIPSYLAFDRIMVAWGDDALTFWLTRR
jgi:2'-5' RNA ligase